MAMVNLKNLNTLLQYIVTQPVAMFNKHIGGYQAGYKQYALAPVIEKDKEEFSAY